MFPKPLAAAIFSLALAACGERVVVKTVCPPIKQYTPEFQTKLADELDATPADRAMAVAVVDYHALRNVIRACEAR
jgi:hypothetical protein